MSNKNDNITRIIHWVFALFVLTLVGVGFYMANTEYVSKLYWLHKSFGTLLLLIIGIRLYWRSKHPWKSSTIGTKYETPSRWVHNLLIFFLIAMPISGALSSGFGGYGIHIFDWNIVPKNFDATLGEIVPFNEKIAGIGHQLHYVFGYIFAAFLAIHILAALKHHFIDKDNTLKKMLGIK